MAGTAGCFSNLDIVYMVFDRRLSWCAVCCGGRLSRLFKFHLLVSFVAEHTDWPAVERDHAAVITYLDGYVVRQTFSY